MYLLNEVSTQDMQNAQDAFTNLQDTLESARSSTFSAVPLDKVNMEGLLETASANGAAAHNVQSDELEGFLAKNKQLMSDGKPDVVVVRFPAADTLDASSTDAVIGSAQKAISDTTQKYTSILSTLSSMETGVASNLAFKFLQSSGVRSNVHNLNANATLSSDGFVDNIGLYTKSLSYGTTNYLTPTLLVAILVMIYMAVLAISAYCCLLSLQTPEKFEGDQEKDMARALNQDAK